MKYRSVHCVLLCAALEVAVFTNASGAIQGDINQDGIVGLQDAILGLQITTGMTPDIPPITEEIDVNQDGQIGLAEVIHALNHPSVSTVTSAGQVWMDKNLGAFRVAISSDDARGFGDLYQWGRGSDGHEKRDSGNTVITSSTDDPGHGSFIVTTSPPNDWRVPQNDDLWQGVSGTNNPCPSGFRVPTINELVVEQQSWNNPGAAGAFDSPLKLTLSGLRDSGSGSVQDFVNGYWSSTSTFNPLADHSNSHTLIIGQNSSMTGTFSHALGFAVRCIKD